MNYKNKIKIFEVTLFISFYIIISFNISCINKHYKNDEMNTDDSFSIFKIDDNPIPISDGSNFKFETIRGAEFSILQKNCYRFYKNRIPGSESDIKIKQINNRIAVIERPDSLDGTIISVDDIWIFRNNMWMKLGGFSNISSGAIFLNLNSDELIDAIIEGGCCDSITYNVFLGDNEQVLKYIQEISFFGEVKNNFKGKCKNSIYFSPYPTMRDQYKSKKIIFNCEKNKFIEYQ